MEIADKNTQDFRGQRHLLKLKTFLGRQHKKQKANLIIKIGLKIQSKALDVFVVREVMHQIYAYSKMRNAIYA